jgi:hypothetical protein
MGFCVQLASLVLKRGELDSLQAFSEELQKEEWLEFVNGTLEEANRIWNIDLAVSNRATQASATAHDLDFGHDDQDSDEEEAGIDMNAIMARFSSTADSEHESFGNEYATDAHQFNDRYAEQEDDLEEEDEPRRFDFDFGTIPTAQPIEQDEDGFEFYFEPKQEMPEPKQEPRVEVELPKNEENCGFYNNNYWRQEPSTEDLDDLLADIE